MTDAHPPHPPQAAHQVITPREERFEAVRRRAGFVLAPLAFAIVLLLPAGGMKPEAHRLAAVMAAVVILWMTEALPMPATALLGAAAAVVLRVAPAKEVFAPFADPLIFLFIGSFILARAIFLHGLDRRVAYAVLAMRWIGGRPSRVLLAFGAVTATLSGWMSNTATTAMMFGIGMSILSVMTASGGAGRPTIDPRYATGLMLMTSFAASIGGLATPVGTPPNVIGIGFIRGMVKQEITFFEWMAVGVPVVVLLFICLYLYMNALSPAGVAVLGDSAEVIRRARAELGPWSSGQRSVALAFGLTAVLWITPGLFALTLGEGSSVYRGMSARLPESAAALIGALLLFVLPGDGGARAITWDDAARIDWGVILLYGGGFALGVLSFQTGLAEAVGRGLTGFLPLRGEFGLLLASVVVAVLVSETTSNTASANMVVPVVISIAVAQGIDPLLPALGATMAASLGFMLPVSTPCNAIVYGSGYVPLMRMVRYGIILDLIGIVVITGAVWLLAPWVR
ncbi:DASS family sodium-coupled anion symporter [Longimicrobium sp.]|uniref:SLC13 family permease n=1 Tax=Longimicrobium sp. TaxID=2029185 RepID=UPI002F9559B0